MKNEISKQIKDPGFNRKKYKSNENDDWVNNSAELLADESKRNGSTSDRYDLGL